MCAEKVWETMAWAVHEGEVLFLKELRFVFGWRTTVCWRNRSAWGHGMGQVEHYFAGRTSGDSIIEVLLRIHLWPDVEDHGKIGYRSGERTLPRIHHYRSKR